MLTLIATKPYYMVYEVSKEYPKGKRIKETKSKKIAEKTMNKSIYRYMKETTIDIIKVN